MAPCPECQTLAPTAAAMACRSLGEPMKIIFVPAVMTFLGLGLYSKSPLIGDLQMNTFRSRLMPAPVGGGFAMDDYWIWGGSVVKDSAGRFHMFVSRWPKSLPFCPHWVTNSEIVRASSDTPEGPYVFEEVVLPARGPEYWDGRMTHNPTIHKCAGTYLLFYIGTTYEGPAPTPETQKPQGIKNSALALEAWSKKRIGLATSHSVYGPWVRQSGPILLPRPGKWDALMTTNPAACVWRDGRVLLLYKSTADQDDLLRLGVAQAKHFAGPYSRLKDDPILCFDETGDHVEDPYVWRSEGGFEAIMKDMNGGICGEKNGGIHAISDDGIDWCVSEPALAYSRTVVWDDGTTTTQGCLERPQLLIQDGRPTHVFFATADGPGAYTRATRTWNMVIPLRPENGGKQ